MSVSQQAVSPHMWALVLLRVAKERYRRGLGIRELLDICLHVLQISLQRQLATVSNIQKPFINITNLQIQ